MKLFNVRLTDEDAAKVRELKRRGVALSTLVRDAIRSEHQRHQARPRTAEDIRRIMDDIQTKYPEPDDTPRIGIDTTDRRAVRAYVRMRPQPAGE